MIFKHRVTWVTKVRFRACGATTHVTRIIQIRATHRSKKGFKLIVPRSNSVTRRNFHPCFGEVARNMHTNLLHFMRPYLALKGLKYSQKLILQSCKRSELSVITVFTKNVAFELFNFDIFSNFWHFYQFSKYLPRQVLL